MIIFFYLKILRKYFYHLTLKDFKMKINTYYSKDNNAGTIMKTINY